MRKDFGKVVIERPRHGSHNRNAKVRQFGKIVRNDEGELEYHGYTKIPSSMNGRLNGFDSKDFTDVLGPLRGFLLNSVGRPWDDVWSEMKRVLGRAPYPVQHILKDHVDVHQNAYRGQDGNLWSHGKFGPQEITGLWRGEFYVEHSILRFMPPTRRSGRPWNWVAPDPNIKDIGSGQHLVRIAGIWYLGRYQAWDVKPVLGFSFPNTAAGYFIKEKQASKKDLKRA